MFLVGLELNAGRAAATRPTPTVAISHASIVVPFLLGAALALWLYPRLSHRGVPFTSFALFLGVAMSVTAFPVLARILTDRGLDTDRAGRHRPRLRRRRRRDRVVPAGVRGRRGPGRRSAGPLRGRSGPAGVHRGRCSWSSARWPARLRRGSTSDGPLPPAACRWRVRGGAAVGAWRPRRSASTPSSGRSCSGR